MRRAVYILFVAAALMSCSKKTPTNMNEPPIQWPPLADYPCVSGRVATTIDTAANRAVFVLQSKDGKLIGHPLDIKIPQYAFNIDEQTHERKPCVVIQAEQVQNDRVIGCRTLPDGKLLAALYREFEFLGYTPPQNM